MDGFAKSFEDVTEIPLKNYFGFYKAYNHTEDFQVKIWNLPLAMDDCVLPLAPEHQGGRGGGQSNDDSDYRDDNTFQSLLGWLLLYENSERLWSG
jgi:hypothetical protein